MDDRRDQLETAGATPRTPPLVGRHVELRPVMPGDYGFLHLAETTGALGPRWRFRGSTPSPDHWTQATWTGVLAQFLVIGRTSGRPVGLVVAHQASFQDGHAQVSAARFGSLASPSPAMILGLTVFLNYVFGCWNFRKLYMDVAEYNYHQFASGQGRIFEIEGRLRQHSFLAGRYWDQLNLAIYREQWAEGAARTLRLELGQ